MRIRRAVLREIPLELREYFEISSGGTQARRVVLLTLEAEDGITAWSECVAGETPGYSYETTDTAWFVLTRWLLPALVGSEVEDGRRMHPVPWLRGHPMARAAIEMAGWDLEARRRNVSLASLLGATTTAVPVGVSIGIQETDDALIERIEGFIAEGYRKIKIKIKPGRDVEMLSAVRKRFPDAPIMADANSAYVLDRDLSRLQAMDSDDLMMIEQPLSHEDMLDHSILQKRIRTPVCLDESIRSPGDARLALHLEAGRIINIKPGRVGGLGPSVAIHDACVAAGWPVWCGGMLESGVGRAYNVALAALPGFTIPGDISNSRRYWARDIVSPEFEMVDGLMPVPDGPGIGVTPDIERIEALTVRKEVFSA